MHYLLIFILFSINLMAADKPNVVIILTDDLGWGDVSYNGGPILTPNIDKLSEKGVRFINAQSNVPVCQPSRNSLFTGVYPHRSKDFKWTSKEKQSVLMHNKTIMQFFQENG